MVTTFIFGDYSPGMCAYGRSHEAATLTQERLYAFYATMPNAAGMTSFPAAMYAARRHAI